MTNTKLNYNGIWKQNVSTSENALKKHHFCEWTHIMGIYIDKGNEGKKYYIRNILQTHCFVNFSENNQNTPQIDKCHLSRR